jgi:1-acyl-sn-glycerol-3-phosphate acyltransferase
VAKVENREYNAPIKFGPLNYIVYYVCRTICWPLVHILWRTKTNGLENLRSIKGPAIVAPTHRSAIDPIVLGLLTRRPLRPLAKAEITDYRFGRLFKLMGVSPLRRGEADREALRTANAWLDAGELMLVFPEGTRKEGAAVVDLHGGVGYLAAKNNVPVIPIGIGGSELAMPKGARFIHPANVHVEIGKPIIPDPNAKLRDSSAQIMEKLSTELQRAYDLARSASA